jgi:hypothetical protein
MKTNMATTIALLREMLARQVLPSMTEISMECRKRLSQNTLLTVKSDSMR